MTRGIYIGDNNKAKTVAKAYVGVSGKAREVIYMYIGVNGKAKMIWPNTVAVRVTYVAPLSVARDHLAATKVGNYALFGGGETTTYSNDVGSYTTTAVVDYYNTSLVKGVASSLQLAREDPTGTYIGNYALFCGGSYYTNSSDSTTSTVVSTVDAYNTSLTRSSPTALSVSRSNIAGATFNGGNYTLLGGGSTGALKDSAAVDAYNASLTKTSPTSLSLAGSKSAVAVGNYILFNGHQFGSDSNTTEAYNTSLTRSTITSLSVTRTPGTASIANYGLFAGGSMDITKYSDTVEAYNASLTCSTITSLSVARSWVQGFFLNNYVLFGGGVTGMLTYTSIVDIYNTSLTRENPSNVSTGGFNYAATTVGNYGLFGGGNNSSRTSNVDAFQII